MITIAVQLGWIDYGYPGDFTAPVTQATVAWIIANAFGYSAFVDPPDGLITRAKACVILADALRYAEAPAAVTELRFEPVRHDWQDDDFPTFLGLVWNIPNGCTADYFAVQANDGVDNWFTVRMLNAWDDYENTKCLDLSVLDHPGTYRIRVVSLMDDAWDIPPSDVSPASTSAEVTLTVTQPTVEVVPIYGVEWAEEWGQDYLFIETDASDDGVFVVRNYMPDGIAGFTTQADVVQERDSKNVLLSYVWGDFLTDIVGGFSVVRRWTHTIGDATHATATFSTPQGRLPNGANTIPPHGDQPDPGWRFSDVPPWEWFYEAVEYLASRGYVNGVGNGLFGVTDPIKRGQLAAIIGRITGTTPGNIDDPDANVSRQDVMLAAANLIGNYEVSAEAYAALDEYGDAASIGEDYRKAAAACVALGIVSGTSETTLSPLETCTRAQIAVILYRAIRFRENVIVDYDNNVLIIGGVKAYDISQLIPKSRRVTIRVTVSGVTLPIVLNPRQNPPPPEPPVGLSEVEGVVIHSGPGFVRLVRKDQGKGDSGQAGVSGMTPNGWCIDVYYNASAIYARDALDGVQPSRPLTNSESIRRGTTVRFTYYDGGSNSGVIQRDSDGGILIVDAASITTVGTNEAPILDGASLPAPDAPLKGYTAR